MRLRSVPSGLMPVVAMPGVSFQSLELGVAHPLADCAAVQRSLLHPLRSASFAAPSDVLTDLSPSFAPVVGQPARTVGIEVAVDSVGFSNTRPSICFPSPSTTLCRLHCVFDHVLLWHSGPPESLAVGVGQPASRAT